MDEENVEIEEGSLDKDVLYIEKRLAEAKKYKLIAEVVTSALYAMQRDSQMSIYDAIEEGCNEWNV